jgi:hypothetical protein
MHREMFESGENNLIVILNLRVVSSIIYKNVYPAMSVERACKDVFHILLVCYVGRYAGGRHTARGANLSRFVLSFIAVDVNQDG